MFFSIIGGINTQEILLVGHVALHGFFVCIIQDLFHQLGGTRDVVDLLQLVEALLGNSAQTARSVAVEVGTEACVDVVQMVADPLPYRTVFGVRLVGKSARLDAITIVQDVGIQILDHDILLSPLFRLHIESAPHREFAQGHDDQARGIGTRTAGHARHALAAVPDRVAFQQFLQIRLILARDDVHNVFRIVFVELRSRTNRRANAAVHAGLHPLFDSVVLVEFLNKMSFVSVFHWFRKTTDCKCTY